ncbi:PE-PGRS family protein [Streptomyces sp. NPDC048255]|uniref:PE-PGRS family protein n=1 Tax=Streptomyces sp. NPDC048255 TaxID=3154713 RepID=UPI0033F6437F
MGDAWATGDEWDGLEYGDAVGERLRQARRDGLVWNRAAPDEILVRLLDTTPSQLWRRDLPSAVVDAAVEHPDRAVRGRLAEARMHAGMSAEHWSRLLLGEPDQRKRHLMLCAAADARAELTGRAYEVLAADSSVRIREEVARFSGLPLRLRTALAADPEPRVRAAACAGGWPEFGDAARARLAADPAPAVRTAVTLARHEEVPLTVAFFEAAQSDRHLVGDHRLERRLAARLAADEDPRTRRALAGNPYLDPDLLERLAADPDDGVRLAVSTRPELTEEQRAAVRVDIDPLLTRHPLPWVEALHEDPEAMRRLAASAHLLVRSSVATARRLPPDVVERLARDDDRVVRLFLAERCDDAPAEMLLEVWQWWNGSLSTPDRPYGHPNFPRRDLLRYAEDPHPRLRQLALDDPDSTPGLVERFSSDEDPEVRLRAATDPRLSAEAAVRLLADPDAGVRAMAARHPRLPVPVLLALLADEHTADAAARNPVLPLAVMARMADTVPDAP